MAGTLGRNEGGGGGTRETGIPRVGGTGAAGRALPRGGGGGGGGRRPGDVDGVTATGGRPGADRGGLPSRMAARGSLDSPFLRGGNGGDFG